MRTFEARSAAAKRAAQTRRHMKAGPTVAEIVTERQAAARESLRNALTVALAVLEYAKVADPKWSTGPGENALRLVRAELEKL